MLYVKIYNISYTCTFSMYMHVMYIYIYISIYMLCIYICIYITLHIYISLPSEILEMYASGTLSPTYNIIYIHIRAMSNVSLPYLTALSSTSNQSRIALFYISQFSLVYQINVTFLYSTFHLFPSSIFSAIVDIQINHLPSDFLESVRN